MLTIHLEESDCFSAWVSAKDVGVTSPEDSNDPKGKCTQQCADRLFVYLFYNLYCGNVDPLSAVWLRTRVHY